MGRKCAMCVEVNDCLTNPYYIKYYCGLVNLNEIIDHGEIDAIEWEEQSKSDDIYKF
jgi:hypothetical protein